MTAAAEFRVYYAHKATLTAQKGETITQAFERFRVNSALYHSRREVLYIDAVDAHGRVIESKTREELLGVEIS